MEIEEIQDFADWEIKRLDKAYNLTNEKAKFRATMKLTEEVGELMNEISKKEQMQRKEKSEFKEQDLAEEFADVILTACIIARRYKIDIIDALETKIDKVRQRRYT